MNKLYVSQNKDSNSLKNYKDFEKEFIGESDIAALILVGPSDIIGLSTVPLFFGEDNSYSAYICNEKCIIGDHYRLVFTCNNWLKIYDDDGLVKKFKGEIINVYRAGEMGCIIEICDD